MSALDGSLGAVKAKLDELPAYTLRVAGNVAVGATFATGTAVVYAVKPPSLAMSRPRTVADALKLARIS